MTPAPVRDKVVAMPGPATSLVKSCPLFSDLDEKTLERLAGDFIVRDFAPGAVIAQQGAGGLNFFIIESGEATVTIGDDQVATLGAGDSFGEVALVDREARSASVTATTQMRTYALPIWSFRSFVETRPDVSWKLLELLAERLRAAQSRQ